MDEWIKRLIEAIFGPSQEAPPRLAPIYAAPAQPVLIGTPSSDQWRSEPSDEWRQVVRMLVESPFARDTLFSLTGTPDTVAAGGELLSERLAKLLGGSTNSTLGTYDRGVLQLNETLRDRPADRLEQTLIHEATHMLDARSPIAFGANAKLRSKVYRRFPEFFQRQGKDSRFYPTVGPAEHFATGMVVGINTMRLLSERPEQEKEIVDAIDYAYPGVSDIVEWLKMQPVYRDHPLLKRERSRREAYRKALEAQAAK